MAVEIARGLTQVNVYELCSVGIDENVLHMTIPQPHYIPNCIVCVCVCV